MNDFFGLLQLMKELDASDLHIKFGRKPILRIRKDLKIIEEWEKPFTREDIYAILQKVMPKRHIEIFEETKEADFAFDDPDVGRYRVNAFKQRGYTGLVFRRIKDVIPTFSEINLPPVLEKISMFNDGIVLVTGPTGCGKSTTLAAMIENINKQKERHIITIEDPIEYLYKDKKSVINQREVGIDTNSFAEALKHVLREDPDIILIGELRDVDTFQAAINACETGHLVFTTLHTVDTLSTIARILDFFPSSQQEQVRKTIGYHLRASVCQKLVPKKDETGMIPVCEIMVVTPLISKLIQENKMNKIYSAMASDKETGMQTFNQHLVKLIQGNVISQETGFAISPAPHTLEMNLRGIFLDEDTKIIGE
ncbi:MAG TPA: PilT/PilU family type 4a pilus ATPase [bacterium]|nr:PilT/PilU family type 4a pilus ATPase [bacterium]HPP29463.1 PilT/PilU family type 4a pilus ATPase [bacterium]